MSYRAPAPPPPEAVPAWRLLLEVAYAEHQHAAAVQLITFVDDHLPDHLGPIEDLLRTADVDRLPPNVMIAILNASFPVRDALPSRAEFVARVERALAEKLGPERTARLLASRR